MSEERAVVSTTGTAMSSMFEFGGNIERAWKFAEVLSRSKIIPDTFQGNPASVLIALDMSNRMRRNPLEVMQAMHVIHGKPSFASNFLISLINSCGYYEPLRFRLTGDGDSRACVAWTVDKRTGEKMEGPAISIHMAKSEGWYDRNGSKWKTMPEVMLCYRAASFFSRIYCPDLTGGFHSQEEAMDTAEPDRPDTGVLSGKDLQAQIVEEIEPAMEVPAPQPALAPIDPIPVEPDTPAFPVEEPAPAEPGGAPEPLDDHKQESPKKPKPFSELEKLRAEVESIMGPEGLDYTAGKRAEFFFQHGGDTELVHIKPNGLAKILTEARKVLQKKDAEAAAHAPDAPHDDGMDLFR